MIITKHEIKLLYGPAKFWNKKFIIKTTINDDDLDNVLNGYYSFLTIIKIKN